MKNKILNLLGRILSLGYRYKDNHFNDEAYIKFFVWQKILGINRKVPWPVHFTSYVTGIKNIKFGKKCSPGSNIGQYIQANGTIEMGDNVLMGPGSKIISSNHDFSDFTKHVESEAVKIGSNVWVGADAIILPGVTVGDNVVIGAGSIVTKDIPSNTIAAGNPCKVLKEKGEYKG